jgi:hypothetical protein
MEAIVVCLKKDQIKAAWSAILGLILGFCLQDGKSLLYLLNTHNQLKEDNCFKRIWAYKR